MLTVYGVLLLATSAVLFVWAYGQFRRATPKRWTTRESATNGVVLTIISLLAFGIGMVAKGLISLENTPISWLQMAIIATIVAAAAAMCRVLRRTMAQHMDASSAEIAGPTGPGVMPIAAAANDPGSGDKPRPASGSRRRAA